MLRDDFRWGFYKHASGWEDNEHCYLQVLQEASSLPSAQSFLRSHTTSWGMQIPSPQRHSFSSQSRSKGAQWWGYYDKIKMKTQGNKLQRDISGAATVDISICLHSSCVILHMIKSLDRCWANWARLQTNSITDRIMTACSPGVSDQSISSDVPLMLAQLA